MIMNTNSTLEQLRELKLGGMAAMYQTYLEQPLEQRPEPHVLLGMLAEAELGHRRNSRTELYVKTARLRYHALPEQVICNNERGLPKEQFLELCEGAYLRHSTNILVTGATGCGKSFLACALGRQACIMGYRTLYYSMTRFIEVLAASRLDGTYIKWLNQIARTPLLILDDFGLKQLDTDMRLTLLQILEDRYRKGATIVTSQLPVAKWHPVVGDPSIADGILDRLSARANRIDLKGASLRKEK